MKNKFSKRTIEHMIEAHLHRAAHVKGARQYVSLQGFCILIIAVLLALSAVFNYVLINRGSDDYTVMGWIIRVPLAVTFGVFALCFMVMLMFMALGSTLYRSVSVLGLLVVVASVFWALVDEPAEFDSIKPASIDLKSVFQNEDTLPYALASVAGLLYSYVMLLGGSARLDKMNLLSANMLMFSVTLFTVSYLSASLSALFADYVNKKQMEHGDLFYFGVLAFSVLLGFLVIYGIEEVAMRMSGYGHTTGNFMVAFNIAPAEIHNAAHATYDTVRWSLLTAVFLPAACMWVMRDNFTPLSEKEEEKNVRNGVKTFGIASLVVPVASVLLQVLARDSTVFSWLINVLFTQAVNAIVYVAIASFVFWTPNKLDVVFGLAMLLNIFEDFVHRGKTGEALNYTLVHCLITRLVTGMDGFNDPQMLPLAVGGAVALYSSVDIMLRNRHDKDFSSPMFFSAFSICYGLIHFHFYDEAAQDPKTAGGKVLDLLIAFFILNTFMNASFDSLHNLPGTMSQVFLPVFGGLLGGYIFFYAKQQGFLVENFEFMQQHAKAKDKEFVEELRWVI